MSEGKSEPAARPAAHDPSARLAQAEAAARDKRYGEADGICRDLLKLQPDMISALGLRGTIAAIEGNVELGIEMLERALAAQPQNLGWTSALADMYRMSCRMDEALALGIRAVRARPGNAGFLVNLAKTHADRGEAEDALRHYITALAINPKDANAHLGIGQILLARGEFRPGWIEYEWRNDLDQAKGRMPPIKAAQWNGMALPSGRLLLIGDQGFGDTLQFSRYIPMAAARCQEVVVAGANDFGSLLGTIRGVGRIFSKWADIPGFSAWSHMSSLPYVFGTEMDTIPQTVPYIRPDPDKVARWAVRLGAASGRRVGLFWSGRPTHPNNLRRSAPLQRLRALDSVPGVTLVSLQKEIGRADRAEMASWRDLRDVSEHFSNFEETAALICNLDLVITVDSAVGHLAGALGRPVWVMLANPPDWRWLLGRQDTPWYPTMRLFRQSGVGDWEGVAHDVAECLAAWMADNPKIVVPHSFE